MAQHFKDLVVWQKAMDLVVAVYRVSETFPQREVYSLTNQIRRAAISVPSNIAEGQAHFNKGDFSATLQALWPSSRPN
jgi:four helix bundle protein